MFTRASRMRTLMAVRVCFGFCLATFARQAIADEPLKGRGAFGDREPMMDGPRAVGRLLDSLNLDDSQRKAIDDSIRAIHEANKGKMPRPTEEQITQMQDLREQMHEAWQSQDTTKLDELKGQMDQLTAPERQAHEAVRQQIHDAIKGQLRPDQVDAFETKWNAAAANAGPHGRRGPAMVVRGYHRAVMSLDLSTDQRAQIDGFFKTFRNSMQNKSGQQQTDHKTAFENLRTQVNSALTDAQKKQLASKLKNGQQHRRGGGSDAPSTGAPESSEPQD